jgi:hypothetical protein
MGTLTNIQYAWAIYFAGALGCTIAAWWMFLWAWRFVRYSAVATVMTLLFTPYAIDPQTMTMAPAIYTLVFDGMSLGFKTVQPLMKLMVGIWLILEIIILVLVVLTRKSNKPHKQDTRGNTRTKTRAPSSRRYEQDEPQPRDSSRGLSREEYQARTELMKGEIPIRAIRD